MPVPAHLCLPLLPLSLSPYLLSPLLSLSIILLSPSPRPFPSLYLSLYVWLSSLPSYMYISVYYVLCMAIVRMALCIHVAYRMALVSRSPYINH